MHDMASYSEQSTLLLAVDSAVPFLYVSCLGPTLTKKL